MKEQGSLPMLTKKDSEDSLLHSDSDSDESPKKLSS